MVSVEPHEFERLSFWDIPHGNTARCKLCLYPKWPHKYLLRDKVWTPARAIGDRTFYETREVEAMRNRHEGK